MIQLLIYIAIFTAFVCMISAPYIAALLYTTVSILQPQYVWFWAFDGVSIFKISAGLAIVAWLLSAFRGQVNWRAYHNGIFYAMLITCIIFYLSNFLTPFPNYSSAVSSSLVIDIYTTIFIMFFICIGLINDKKSLKFLVFSLIAVTLYYIYWSNSAYFGGNWFQFQNGRLEGPGGSPYRDGNVFSVLFVIGLPFLLFMIYQVDKKWQKALFILAIPLLWHALVLCASRGALLSAGVSTLMVAWMVRSKAFNVVLVAGFCFFIIDQGGQVVSRATETVKRADTQANAPINPRIASWTVGINLALKHPILGVGPQRFIQASAHYYPGKSVHVAHNTFLNFSANTGLISGLCYLSFFWVARKMYKWNKKALESHPDKFHTYVNKASIVAMVGFFVGAVFLDLIIFEPFYFLLLVIVVNHAVLRKTVNEASEGINTSAQSINQSAMDKNATYTKGLAARGQAIKRSVHV